MSAGPDMKRLLRQRMREEAKSYNALRRAEDSRRICERIRALEVWRKAQSVLLFVPTAQEPDISPLMHEGKRVSLPAFNSNLGQYQAREAQGGLVHGRFGILEPSPTCALIKEMDVVLAPGVAFALDGTRLGRGQGFYDRLLADVKAVKIGVCFDWQMLTNIPRDVHDILMDHIVTPTLST